MLKFKTIKFEIFLHCACTALASVCFLHPSRNWSEACITGETIYNVIGTNYSEMVRTVMDCLAVYLSCTEVATCFKHCKNYKTKYSLCLCWCMPINSSLTLSSSCQSSCMVMYYVNNMQCTWKKYTCVCLKRIVYVQGRRQLFRVLGLIHNLLIIHTHVHVFSAWRCSFGHGD